MEDRKQSREASDFTLDDGEKRKRKAREAKGRNDGQKYQNYGKDEKRPET